MDDASSPANCRNSFGHGDAKVLGDRQVGQHRRVLVDDGDAQPAGGRRIERGHGARR